MSHTEIIAQNLAVSRPGTFRLQSVCFKISNGQHLVITGPSGSGKTTLGEALCGRLFCTGELKITYDAVSILPPTIKWVAQRYTIKNRSNTVDGYYQQRYNSTENEDAYTVMEELKTVLDDTDRIGYLLREFSIEYLADKTLLKLSSGEHKRFQLVKLLLSPSQVIILDEPFVGLDVTSRKKLNKMLVEIAAQGSLFIIIAGARDHFPEIITDVLELSEDGNSLFCPLAGYTPGFTHHHQPFNISSLPLDKVELAFSHAVKLVSASVRYGQTTILDRITWTVNRGEKWLLKGHNGAGKSTLLSLIYGDNPQAYSNEIYLFDRRRGTGESIWDIKKNIGFVSPELHAFFDKNISCFDAIASGFFDTMGLYKKLNTQQQAAVNAWLKALGLEGIASQRLALISTGQQRLVMLIRAFIKNPALIVLDEPCQGLDQWQTEAFVQLVEDIVARTGAALIYISHYDNEIPATIDQVLELDKGRPSVYRLKKATAENIETSKILID